MDGTGADDVLGAAFERVAGRPPRAIPPAASPESDPVGIAIDRLARALPDSEVRMRAVLAPASPEGRGPIDAVVLTPPTPAAGRHAATLVIPHTRCWLVGVGLTPPIGGHEVLSALASARGVLLADPDVGFSDTAVLADYFRELGRPDGAFFETVAFTGTLDDGTVSTFWVAAHSWAPLPERLAAWLARETDLTPSEALRRADRVLGVLETLPGPARVST